MSEHELDDVRIRRAFLDDLCVLSSKQRAAQAFRTVADSVADRAGVQTHLGKLRVWSSGGGEALEDIASLGEHMWTASQPPELNGVQVLGIPVGTAEYVRSKGQERLTEESCLLDVLPNLPDTQCAWVILVMCAVPRANHLLRTTPPSQEEAYAAAHDKAL